MTNWLEVGRIHRAHGLEGEVQVSLQTEREDRLAVGTRLRADDRELEVASVRPHRDRWLVRFAGVEDRAGADELRGARLSALVEAEAEGLWVHEVIGAEVVTVAGTAAGTVRSVLANPAHEILELDSGALVPAVFIVEERSEPGRLVVDPPDGLLDG